MRIIPSVLAKILKVETCTIKKKKKILENDIVQLLLWAEYMYMQN
jgi:hypothetical protein